MSKHERISSIISIGKFHSVSIVFHHLMTERINVDENSLVFSDVLSSFLLSHRVTLFSISLLYLYIQTRDVLIGLQDCGIR